MSSIKYRKDGDVITSSDFDEDDEEEEEIDLQVQSSSKFRTPNTGNIRIPDLFRMHTQHLIWL